MLAARGVPVLRALGIMNCEFTDELCARLADDQRLDNNGRTASAYE